MTDPFIDTLHSWQNFYFMIGGASAGLMGLMFVALSLGMSMNMVNEETKSNFSPFVTPSILYFVSTILIAGVMLAPFYVPMALGAILVFGGIVGLVRTLPHVRRLIEVARVNQDFNRSDWLTQVILPLGSYIVILLSALGFAFGQPDAAFTGLWLATLILLLCGIANTWGLVIWLTERHGT